MKSYVIVIWYMNEIPSYMRHMKESLGAITSGKAITRKVLRIGLYMDFGGPLSLLMLRIIASTAMYVNGWESPIDEMSSPSSQ
jgi:hypothetical protein